MIYRTLITILLLQICDQAKAQEAKSSNMEIEVGRIIAFQKQLKLEELPDSTSIYAFAFKVDVKKNRQRKIEILSLQVNDTLAYKLYPNYKLLLEVNYSLFMKKRTKSAFIIPIFIDLIGSDLGTKKQVDVDPLDKISALFYCNDEQKASELENTTYFKPLVVRINLKRIR